MAMAGLEFDHGAQEWGWGVGTGRSGGREESLEAQESQEEQRQEGVTVPSMASVSPSVKRKRHGSQDLSFQL